jgi:hypothetical protein
MPALQLCKSYGPATLLDHNFLLGDAIDAPIYSALFMRSDSVVSLYIDSSISMRICNEDLL